VSVWGPILDGADVERALLAHLEHWMPAASAYVRKAKDPTGEKWPEGIAEIREYGVSHADAAAQKWPEDQLPMLIAQSPGMEDDPVVEEGGRVSAVYGVVLSAIASSVTLEDAKELARLYASAARLAIIQNPQLDAGTGDFFSDHVRMGRERNGQVRRGIEGERNLMICSVPYLIAVPQILDVSGGPLVAPPDPEEEAPEWPRVKKGGGSAAVEQLTEGGFFAAKP
jgi:hypothetical protein